LVDEGKYTVDYFDNTVTIADHEYCIFQRMSLQVDLNILFMICIEVDAGI